MKSRALSIAVGAVIVIVLLMYLFSYKVRETETAVLLTFGKPQTKTSEAGLHFRWPYPIQRVERFDRRLNLFDTTLDEAMTADKKPIVISLAVGWRIDDPLTFRDRTGGSMDEAKKYVGQLVNHQSSIVGQYLLENFVSTDKNVMKFGAIEASLTDQVDKAAQATYGVRVPFVRIRNLGLPDSPTRAVYDRMAAERGTEARQSRAEGVGLAGEIVARANSEAGQILAKAKADANRIMAEGDAEAARYYGEFAKNPELAIFLRQIEALKSILSQRSTIVLDPRTMPFNLLSENGVRIPVATKAERAAGVQVPNKAKVSVPARAEAETKVGG